MKESWPVAAPDAIRAREKPQRAFSDCAEEMHSEK